MKFFVMTVFLLGIISLSSVTIYQIQYTNNPGRDNTYPSPYSGKTVTIEGIITATGYNAQGFYLSESTGGAWRGIFVQSARTGLKPGDKVVLKGKVDEQFGMTCINDLINLSVIDSHHPVPYPNLITTGQITTAEQAEAYEGTLVKVQNSSCVQNMISGGRFSVNDGSGVCLVDDAFFTGKVPLYRNGEVFSSLSGIVTYSYGNYSINPRSKTDIAIMAPVFNQNRSWGRIKSIYK